MGPESLSAEDRALLDRMGEVAASLGPFVVNASIAYQALLAGGKLEAGSRAQAGEMLVLIADRLREAEEAGVLDAGEETIADMEELLGALADSLLLALSPGAERRAWVMTVEEVDVRTKALVGDA